MLINIITNFTTSIERYLLYLLIYIIFENDLLYIRGNNEKHLEIF